MKRTNSARLFFSIFLLTFSYYGFSQDQHKTKPWKAKIFSGGVKFKGLLFEVTDSSLVLLVANASPDEILFADMDNIKLVPHHGKGKKRLIGFVVGSIAGAWSGSAGLSKGKQGTPGGVLAGIFGGIGGGVIGATIGTASAPSVYNLFAAKKFRVVHDQTLYHLLKLKLQPYCIKSQGSASSN